MNPIATQVKEFIAETFIVDNIDEIDNDESLLDAGIIDSTGVLEIILFIEQNFGVKINDEEIVPENLDSVTNISKFIGIKVGR